ncbi:MAG: glycosyltransferase family 39 protein [Planctomycetota bacterium]
MTAPPSSSREKPRVVVADGPAARRRRGHWLAVAAATVLAMAVRTYGLGDWSLWIDEAHTWRDATMPFAGEGGFATTDRMIYPLTFLLLRALIDLGAIGEDPASLRLPFVVVGVLTVPLLAVAGRRLVGATPAVCAACLLAVHPWHVYWSQNARGYAFVAFAAVLVVERAFAFARRDRARDFFLVWFGIVFATLCHPTGALLAVAWLAFAVLRRQRFDRSRLLTWTVVGVAVAVALPWLMENSPFQEFLRAKNAPSLAHFAQTVAYYFRPIALVLGALGVALLHRHAGRERALLLGAFLLAPFAVLGVVGSHSVLATARYAIVALPVLLWLVAFACVRLAAALRGAWTVGGVAPWLAAAALPLCVVGEQAISLRDYATIQYGQRARWREAADFLRQRAAGRPLRAVTIHLPTLAYYLRRGLWRGQLADADVRNEVLPITDWMVAEGVDQEKRRVAERGPVGHLAWHRQAAAAAGAEFALVFTLPELAEQDRDGALLAAIRAECELALHLPCWVGPKDESLYVYVWKRS